MGDIINYGEKAMTILFGGKPGEKLDSLRLSTFYQKVAGSVKFVSQKINRLYLLQLNTTHTDLTIKFKYEQVEQILLQKSGVGL